MADNVRKVFTEEGRDIPHACVTHWNGRLADNVSFFLLCGSFAVTEPGHQHSAKYLGPHLPRVNHLNLKCGYVCVVMARIRETLKGLLDLKEIWIGIE